MIAYAVISLASGIVGARMGSQRYCGSFRAFLWGLLFPVAGLARPLLSRRLPEKNLADLRSPLTRAQVNGLLKDSVRDARENEMLKAQVKELQEKVSQLEGTAATARAATTVSQAAKEAAEKRYAPKETVRSEPARQRTQKASPELSRSRGIRR